MFPAAYTLHHNFLPPGEIDTFPTLSEREGNTYNFLTQLFHLTLINAETIKICMHECTKAQ
jgi:hypothetical protein